MKSQFSSHFRHTFAFTQRYRAPLAIFRRAYIVRQRLAAFRNESKFGIPKAAFL